jgi:hypothetical protein
MDINVSAGTDEPVVLEAEHNGDESPMNILGPIDSATITSENQLYIVARLDAANPQSNYYYTILTEPDTKKGRPKQLGLSINGYVKEAHWEYSEELGKTIRVFDRVQLEKVGIVRAPSNPDTWVQKLARSVNWDTVATKENVMLENENQVVEEVTTETTVDRAEETTNVEETVVENTERTEENVEQQVEETAERTEEVIENVEESVQEVVEEVTETTEERSEETVGTTDENVERVDYYTGSLVIDSMRSVMEAMSRMESYICEREDWQEKDATNAKNAVSIMRSAMDTLMACFGESVEPTQRLSLIHI